MKWAVWGHYFRICFFLKVGHHPHVCKALSFVPWVFSPTLIREKKSWWLGESRENRSKRRERMSWLLGCEQSPHKPWSDGCAGPRRSHCQVMTESEGMLKLAFKNFPIICLYLRGEAETMKYYILYNYHLTFIFISSVSSGKVQKLI